MVGAVYTFRKVLNNSSIVKELSYQIILVENGSLFSICQQTAEGRYRVTTALRRCARQYDHA